MDKNIQDSLGLLSNKLALPFEAVKRWYKRNRYDSHQLRVINRQVTAGDICLPPLISSIVDNLDYRITIM